MRPTIITNKLGIFPLNYCVVLKHFRKWRKTPFRFQKTVERRVELQHMIPFNVSLLYCLVIFSKSLLQYFKQKISSINNRRLESICFYLTSSYKEQQKKSKKQITLCLLYRNCSSIFFSPLHRRFFQVMLYPEWAPNKYWSTEEANTRPLL